MKLKNDKIKNKKYGRCYQISKNIISNGSYKINFYLFIVLTKSDKCRPIKSLLRDMLMFYPPPQKVLSNEESRVYFSLGNPYPICSGQ